MKLDKKDLQILNILDWNSRMPITQMAKKVKLNKDVVRYRIKNLEEKGIISGYYTLVNISKLGYLTFRLYFDLKDNSSEVEKKIINYLDNDFDSGIIFSRDGEYQLGVITWEKSVYDFESKLKKFKQKFGDYLDKIDFTIFTEFNHYSLNDFNKNFSREISIKKEEVIFVKEDDLKILMQLSKNSRISSVELGEKLKIPQTTIIHKVKEFEKKKIVLAYRTKIDFSKLDYENYFLEIYTHNGKEINKFEKYISNHVNCTYSVKGIFGADIEIECEFKSKTELTNFIKELKEKFKSISKIKYCSTLKYYKINYFPN